MSIITPVPPMQTGIEAEPSTAMSGLIFGLLLSIPLWAGILAFLL